MKRQKSIGIRILLGIVAVALGTVVQVVGAFIDKFIWIGILPQYSFGVLGFLFGILGFVVMGYLIYRWAIK
jgi:hypothetical protein